MDGRVGVVFNISERYMLGSLSLLAVGMAPHEMYSTMQKVLNFLAAKEQEGGHGAGGRNGRCVCVCVCVKEWCLCEACVCSYECLKALMMDSLMCF